MESRWTLNKRSSTMFLAALGVALVIAVYLASDGKSLGLLPLAAAVTAMGVGVVVLIAIDVLIVRQLRAFQRAEGAATTPFRGLLLVLGLGLAIAAAFVLTDNQLGIFPLEAAVTGLGFVFLALVLVTAWMLWSLSKAGVMTVFPGEPIKKPPQTMFVHLEPSEEGQHILLIEGIGEKYASRLNSRGIITIPQLLRSTEAQIAQAAQVTQQLARDWQAMGIFMGLKGIGPQYAEVLVDVGVKTVQQLAASDAQELTDRIATAAAGRKNRLQGSDIRAGTVQRWIDAAKSAL